MSKEKLGTCDLREMGHYNVLHRRSQWTCVNWREQPAQAELSRRHEEWCCLDLDHKGDCKRWMKLPPNPAYPNFKEIHVQDDWCRKAGCVPATKCDIDYHHQAGDGVPSQPSAGEKPLRTVLKETLTNCGACGNLIPHGETACWNVKQQKWYHLRCVDLTDEPSSPPAPAGTDIFNEVKCAFGCGHIFPTSATPKEISAHALTHFPPSATAGTAREWRETHGGKDSWAYWNDDRTEHYAAERVRQAKARIEQLEGWLNDASTELGKVDLDQVAKAARELRQERDALKGAHTQMQHEYKREALGRERAEGALRTAYEKAAETAHEELEQIAFASDDLVLTERILTCAKRAAAAIKALSNV